MNRRCWFFGWLFLNYYSFHFTWLGRYKKSDTQTLKDEIEEVEELEEKV
jgi:hypothetical protein